MDMNKFNNTGFLFPYVRFFNASPHGGSMDFYIGNTLVGAGIKYGSFTGYIKTMSSPVTYKAARSGRKDDIIHKITLSQKVGDVCTLCVTNKADKAEFMIIDEICEKNNMDYGHIRICNLSPENAGLDIYADQRKILGDINFKEISRYMAIRPQSYEISVWKNEKRILNCHSLDMRQGKFNTLYIIGLLDEVPKISNVFSVDAASYNGFYL